jgi:hypothetical protein
MSKLYTTGDVAQMLNRKQVSIAMNAVRHNIGQVIGKMRLFTEEDVEKLRGITSRGPGRPADPTAKYHKQHKTRKAPVPSPESAPAPEGATRRARRARA